MDKFYRQLIGIHIFVPLALVLLCVYQVFSLINFTEKTNRDISRFLLSIRYDDTSQTFSSQGLGSSFGELKDAFNEVMRNVVLLHHQLLNFLVDVLGRLLRVLLRLIDLAA